MCGRYYIEEDDMNEMLVDYIRQAADRADSLGIPLLCAGEIRPTNTVPTIASGASSRTPGAYPMRWGFSHPTRGMLIFNTRSETVREKPLFAHSIQDRRCAIPASGYYEWAKGTDGKKERYAFTGEDGGPLLLAGLYLRPTPDALPCFSILTRDATPALQAVHGRMPLILPAHRLEDWLSPQHAYETFLETPVTDLVCRKG